ncbi:MAG: NifU family protein [Gemmatimonadaceae bacterium]
MALFKQRTGTDVEGDIRTAIDGMRPLLRIETMDIELVTFEMENSVAVIRCTGDCPDCDLSAENLTVGIEAHLRQQVPEIRAVRFVTR